MASSVGIQSPVAVVLEMRTDMERLVLVNNLGSRNHNLNGFTESADVGPPEKPWFIFIFVT